MNLSWAQFYSILKAKLCILVYKRRSRKRIKPKRWSSYNEAGLLHKKRAHNQYLLSQDENDKMNVKD